MCINRLSLMQIERNNFYSISLKHKDQQQAAELSDTEMTIETQHKHDRLHGKTALAVPSQNSNGFNKKSVASQQKAEEYKRLTENTMLVCNVNFAENHLASRYVQWWTCA